MNTLISDPDTVDEERNANVHMVNYVASIKKQIEDLSKAKKQIPLLVNPEAELDKMTICDLPDIATFNRKRVVVVVPHFSKFQDEMKCCECSNAICIH
jgi:hypothetical protein